MTAEEQAGEQGAVTKPRDTVARRRVEEVSLDLFGRRGYESVSLKQIADVVGIHKSSIFHYYRRKRDLAAEVVRGAMERLRDRLRPLVQEGATLQTGLDVLDSVVDLFADQPEDARLVLAYLCAPDDSELKVERRARSTHPGREVYEILALALDRGQQLGVIRPVDGAQLLYALGGLVLLYPAMAGTAEQRLLANEDPFGTQARDARKAFLRQLLMAVLAPQGIEGLAGLSARPQSEPGETLADTAGE